MAGMSYIGGSGKNMKSDSQQTMAPRPHPSLCLFRYRLTAKDVFHILTRKMQKWVLAFLWEQLLNFSF